MKLCKTTQFILTLLLLFTLPACVAPGVKPDQEKTKTDLFKLEHEADVAYQKGDLPNSEKDYLELVKKAPEEALHWFRLGNIYARTHRPQAAIIAYREAVVRKPQYSKAWYNMGIIQLREAANTFNQMQVHTDSRDPLYDEGKKLLDEIFKIIQRKDKKPGVE
jgi:tetratricopeptide (TPR) repeat protein